MRLLFSAALCLWFAAAHAGEIEGQAKPVDGDSFNMEIRLFGIDAPEAGQTCKDGSERDYLCGQIADDALSGFLKDETVRCEIQTLDDRGRPVAICYADGIDIGVALVDQGLAVAFRKYSAKYVPNEEGAHAEKRGLWGGTFEMPWDYRARLRKEAAASLLSVPPGNCPPPPADPRASGCLIKGNISKKGRARIYHMPGFPDYKKVVIKPADGERYFCSEEEAGLCGCESRGNDLPSYAGSRAKEARTARPAYHGYGNTPHSGTHGRASTGKVSIKRLSSASAIALQHLIHPSPFSASMEPLLPFTVELWSSGYVRLEETVARVADFITARAAFEALVKRRPGEPILLRQEARVVLKSIPD